MKTYDRVMLKHDHNSTGTLTGWDNYGNPMVAWDQSELPATEIQRGSLIIIGRSKPTIVCLCGSTRFNDLFQEYSLKETLKGKIVLSIGCNMKDDEVFISYSKEEKELTKIRLDELHKRKIDMADEILVLNKDGYIGLSTLSEIEYAIRHFVSIITIEPLNFEQYKISPSSGFFRLYKDATEPYWS